MKTHEVYLIVIRSLGQPFLIQDITETSPYKSNPRFAPNIMGETWGGIENEKYSLYLNFIDKTCKMYLFIFV